MKQLQLQGRAGWGFSRVSPSWTGSHTLERLSWDEAAARSHPPDLQAPPRPAWPHLREDLCPHSHVCMCTRVQTLYVHTCITHTPPHRARSPVALGLAQAWPPDCCLSPIFPAVQSQETVGTCPVVGIGLGFHHSRLQIPGHCLGLCYVSRSWKGQMDAQRGAWSLWAEGGQVWGDLGCRDKGGRVSQTCRPGAEKGGSCRVTGDGCRGGTSPRQLDPSR